MILCVDIGNTKVKCALGTSTSFTTASVETAHLVTAQEYVSFLRREFGCAAIEQIHGTIVASVVPDKTKIVIDALHCLQADAVHMCVDLAASGIDISGYRSKPGEDRIVCCAAAVSKYKTPLLVVDFGTATTINLITDGNVFAGGAIMVGVQTGLNALNLRTAQLPAVSECDDFGVFSDSTERSLLSGAVFGTAYAVQGFIKQAENLLGGVVQVVITGGNASTVIKHCDFDFVYEPNLMIAGLFELFNTMDEKK